MKYIESRMGKIILMICWIAYLFFCIQPVHTMAATNNNYTVEDDIGAAMVCTGCIQKNKYAIQHIIKIIFPILLSIYFIYNYVPS